MGLKGSLKLHPTIFYLSVDFDSSPGGSASLTSRRPSVGILRYPFDAPVPQKFTVFK